jgi:hypothetical protein
VMDKLAVDLTGPHSTSSKGFVYLLTTVDEFSRFLVAVPLRNNATQTVAEVLYHEVLVVLVRLDSYLLAEGENLITR